MIRFVSGQTPTGHTMMEAVSIPTKDGAVADAMARAYGQIEGWTEISVRTPDSGTMHFAVRPILTSDTLRAWLEAWESAKAEAAGYGT